VSRRAVAVVKRAAATRCRVASVRELTMKLRLILIIAAVGAPTRSTLRESESGARGEKLSELATPSCFLILRASFLSRFSRRAAQGIPGGDDSLGRPFLRLPSFGRANEGNQPRVCHPVNEKSCPSLQPGLSAASSTTRPPAQAGRPPRSRNPSAPSAARPPRCPA